MSGPAPRVAYLLLRPTAYSQTFIDAEIEAVRAAGATVEVFVAGRGDARATQAAAVLRALCRPATLLRHVRGLGFSYGLRGWLAGAHAVAMAPRVAAFRPDVIHAHFVNLPTAIALLVGGELGVPVTATAHAADFLLETRVAALRRRIGRIGHLFVISAATARQLAERGVPMSAVPHSVVRAAFDPRASPAIR